LLLCGSIQFDENDKKLLRKALKRFLQTSERGVQVSGQLSASLTPAEKEFQSNLDMQFNELSHQLEPLLREQKKDKPRRIIRFTESKEEAS